MKILVTGVPGWLGNRCVEWLLHEGSHAIRALALPGADVSTLERLGSGKIEVVRGDVTDPASLTDAVSGIDCVFHLAGIIHPRRIGELYAVNTEGTRHIVEAARHAGVRRLIYVSSNSASGCNFSAGRLMTETDPQRPYLHYGRSKWLAEQAVQAGQRGGLETVILRPCWYYGPGQPARQTRFFRMIKQGHPVMFGSGNNLRSMSYLDNLCQALVLAATVPAAAGQRYWIADERPYATREIYDTVARLLNVTAFRPRVIPGLVSEACLLADRLLQGMGLYISEVHVAGEMNKDIACSIDKAKRELGYRPTVGLEEGMRRSIEWCRVQGIAL